MRKFFLTGLILFIYVFAFGEYIELKDGNTEITVTAKGDNYISFHLTVDGYKSLPVTEGGHEFSSIILDGWGKMSEPGYPALPLIGKKFIVPNDSKPEILVENVEYVIRQTEKPYPAQPFAIDNDQLPSPEFTYNEEYYNKGDVYPDVLAKLGQKRTTRGVNTYRLYFQPFKYNPIEKSLKIAVSLDITVRWTGSRQIDNRLRSKYFDPLIRAGAANSEVLPEIDYNTLYTQVNATREEYAEFIIITTLEMSNAAEEFCSWKTQQGFLSKVFYLEEIGLDASAISDFISAAYETWPITPSFITFIGDADIVPTLYIENLLQGFPNTLGCDHAYAYMDGPYDFAADIVMGRISVEDNDMAMAVVNKIVNYEKNPPIGSAFYNNAVSAGYFQDDEGDNPYDGREDRRFVKTSEEVRDFLLSEGYQAERIYCTESNVNPTYYSSYYADGNPIPTDLLRLSGFEWDGGASDITTAFNEGIFLVMHRDHGISRNHTYDSGGSSSNDGWGDPYFSHNHAAALTNGEMLPFVMTINCQTGWFDGETDSDDTKSYECFSEYLLRNENGGAVGVYGAVRNSLSGYNDFMVWGMMDAMWNEFHSQWDYGETNGYVGIGLLAGFDSMEEYWYDDYSASYTRTIFHNFGDPSLQVWRSEPAEIIAEFNETVLIGQSSISVATNIQQGRAAATINGILIGSYEFDSENFILPFNNTVESTGTFCLTITSRDYRPFQYQTEIIPPTGCFVAVNEMIVDDAEGNDDDEWDAGEYISLRLNYENIGTESGSNITVSLDADPNLVNLTETEFIIDNEITPGQSGFLETTGELAIELNNMIQIPVTITVDNGDLQHISVYKIRVVKLPKINIAGNQLAFTLEDQETVEFPLTITNIGADELHCSFISQTNQGADLSGSMNLIRIPHQDYYNDLSQFSFAAWVKFNSLAGYQYILQKGESSSDRSILIYAQSSQLRYRITNNLDQTLSEVIDYDLIENQWFHFALVANGQNVRVYIDSELQSDESFITPIKTNEEPFLIGAKFPGNFEFSGIIDEVYLYNRAITESEIAMKMEEVTRTMQSGLLGYYRFDENIPLEDFFGFNDAEIEGDINFSFAGAPIFSWLKFDETELSISAYQSVDNQISINPYSYRENEYTSEILIYNNSSNDSLVSVPITLTYTTDIFTPSSVKLRQNNFSCYPNPFNPLTALNFTLAKSGNVELKIYNAKGQLVKTITNREYNAGAYSLIWDGSSENGGKVGSGVYFAIFKNADNMTVKKITLVK